VAEKIAKEHIKRGKLAHKKELLDLAANAKQSLLDKNIDDIFKADTNKAAFSPSFYYYLFIIYLLLCCYHLCIYLFIHSFLCIIGRQHRPGGVEDGDRQQRRHQEPDQPLAERLRHPGDRRQRSPGVNQKWSA
jgi:hypothetical protein